MTLAAAILARINALPREQLTAWREAHAINDGEPMALDWRTCRACVTHVAAGLPKPVIPRAKKIAGSSA